MTTTARDFLALGTARWLLRDLTVAMGHADALDHESLTRELLAGAHAWQIGDWASAVNRLRAGFEVLTQARERFYPVDAYLIDLCLLDPAMPAGVLADPLESPVAISFIAQAQAIENQALHDPQRHGRAAAGDQRRLGRRGGRHLFRGRRPALAAGVDPLAVPAGTRGLSRSPRRSQRRDLRAPAVWPVTPSSRRSPNGSDFGYALHMGFDAGRFPIRPETKRLWESPDGSSSRRCCGRRWRPTGRRRGGLCPGGWRRR